MMIEDFDSNDRVRITVEPWDRFIRSRGVIKRHQQYLCKEEPQDTDAIIDQRLYSSSREQYLNMLASTLSMNVSHQRWNPLWPVKHRPFPIIRSPSVVLDLPNIRNDFCCSLMDWSSTDYLTVAFPRSVHLWHAPQNRTLRFTSATPCCIKWNPEGTDLFTASQYGTFKFINTTAERSTATYTSSRCHTTGCTITSAAFHPSSPLLLLGCSRGAYSLFHVNKGVHFISCVHNNNDCINSLAFSCDGKHFAIANMSGSVVVYSTATYRVLFVIKMTAPCRALAWHPWKRSCLVAADCNGYMAIYNVFLSSTPEASYTPIINSSIICLTFNPLSAELVVSHRLFSRYLNSDDVFPMETDVQLNVLASFDRVVDRIEGHTGRVPFLSWNPDGTKLASSGSDETARIWNFLSHVKKQRTKKSCKLNYASMTLEITNRMGLALR